MSIKFNRIDQDGKVVARGTVPLPENFEALKAQGRPGEYVIGDRPLDLPPRPVLPAPVPVDTPPIEDLIDAVAALADGDRSLIDRIQDRRNPRAAARRKLKGQAP